MCQAGDEEKRDGWGIRAPAPLSQEDFVAKLQGLALNHVNVSFHHMLEARAARLEGTSEVAEGLLRLHPDVAAPHNLTGRVHTVLASHVNYAVRPANHHRLRERATAEQSLWIDVLNPSHRPCPPPWLLALVPGGRRGRPSTR